MKVFFITQRDTEVTQRTTEIMFIDIQNSRK